MVSTSVASSTGTNFSIPVQPGETYVGLSDMYISYDGYHLFYVEAYSHNIVHHTLSTAWDITTASSSYTSYSSSYGDTTGVHFSPDGTQMFTWAKNRKINKFSLSTPWDLSTVSYVNSSGFISNAFSQKGLHISHDGKRVYVVDDYPDQIWQYNLTTPWDISSINSVGGDDLLDVSNIDSQPRQVFVNDSGTNLYWTGDQYGKVYQRAL